MYGVFWADEINKAEELQGLQYLSAEELEPFLSEEFLDSPRDVPREVGWHAQPAACHRIYDNGKGICSLQPASCLQTAMHLAACAGRALSGQFEGTLAWQSEAMRLNLPVQPTHGLHWPCITLPYVDICHGSAERRAHPKKQCPPPFPCNPHGHITGKKGTISFNTASIAQSMLEQAIKQT